MKDRSAKGSQPKKEGDGIEIKESELKRAMNDDIGNSSEQGDKKRSKEMKEELTNQKEDEFELTLVDIKQPLIDAWNAEFKQWRNVQIVKDFFQKIPQFDCMVSAANSFGLMDGGIDEAITRFFGDQLPERVKEHIIEEYGGEQPVGTCFLIETLGEKGDKHPFLAHTPTMRVPKDIQGTDNVYHCMFSMLVAVRNHNRRSEKKIRSVVCPGLGTLSGRVPFEVAAKLMALAYKHFKELPHPMDWKWAISTEREIQSIVQKTP